MPKIPPQTSTPSHQNSSEASIPSAKPTETTYSGRKLESHESKTRQSASPGASTPDTRDVTSYKVEADEPAHTLLGRTESGYGSISDEDSVFDEADELAHTPLDRTDSVFSSRSDRSGETGDSGDLAHTTLGRNDSGLGSISDQLSEQDLRYIDNKIKNFDQALDHLGDYHYSQISPLLKELEQIEGLDLEDSEAATAFQSLWLAAHSQAKDYLSWSAEETVDLSKKFIALVKKNNKLSEKQGSTFEKAMTNPKKYGKKAASVTKEAMEFREKTYNPQVQGIKDEIEKRQNTHPQRIQLNETWNQLEDTLPSKPRGANVLRHLDIWVHNIILNHSFEQAGFRPDQIH